MGGPTLRRRALLASAGGALAAFTGCQTAVETTTEPPSGGQDRSDGRRELSTSFEQGELGRVFADVSQSGVAPEFTTEHSETGERGLLLQSRPGGDTTCKIVTRAAFELPVRAEVRVKRLTDVTARTKFVCNLKSAAWRSWTALRYSRYRNQPVDTRVVNANRGERIRGIQSTLPPMGEWETVSVTVSPDEVTVAVGDSERSVPVGDLRMGPSHLVLNANAWQNASSRVAVAVDWVRIGPP